MKINYQSSILQKYCQTSIELLSIIISKKNPFFHSTHSPTKKQPNSTFSSKLITPIYTLIIIISFYQNSKKHIKLPPMQSPHQQHQHDPSKQHKSIPNKSLQQSSPKSQYRGMTLKQYFGLCDNNISQHQINQIDEQSRCSSSQQIPQTPTFGLNDRQPTRKTKPLKLKTEINDYQQQYDTRKQNSKKKFLPPYPLPPPPPPPPYPSYPSYPCPLISPKYSNLKIKGQQCLTTNKNNFDKNQRKRMVSIPSKNIEQSKQLVNRSTLTSFYHLQQKNRKMLMKLKSQKSKIDDLKLADAFLITKYAAKFMVDSKELVAS